MLLRVPSYAFYFSRSLNATPCVESLSLSSMLLFTMSNGLDYCISRLAGLVVQFGIIPDWQNLYFTFLKTLFGRATIGMFGPRWVMVEFLPAYGSRLKPIWL